MRSPHRRPGQSLLEFALVLPLLVLGFVGLAEFGFLLQAHVQVANATREATRAGSLYLGGRFQYTSCTDNCPAGYGYSDADGGCWRLSDWIDNALLERVRTSDGCPTSVANTNIHAFGGLRPQKCPSESSGTGCYLVTSIKLDRKQVSNGASVADQVALSVANVGKPIAVTVVYRYELPLFGAIFKRGDQVVMIKKTMLMRMQAK